MTLIRVGDLLLSTADRTVTAKGETIHLPVNEFRLLVLLARDPERIVVKSTLLLHLAPNRTGSSSRMLDALAADLRARLSKFGSYVINVWGLGYRLVNPPGSAAR